MALNGSSHFRAASIFQNFVMPDIYQPFRTICLLCLKCVMFVCNASLDCSIFVSEDFPGRRVGASVALCMNCDKLENWSVCEYVISLTPTLRTRDTLLFVT